MSCYPTCGAILGAAEVVPRAAAVGGAAAASRGGGCGCAGVSVVSRGTVSGGSRSTNGNGKGRTRRSAAGTIFLSSSSSAGVIISSVVGGSSGIWGNRATSAAFASRNQRSTNAVVGAISDARRSGQFKSLGDDGAGANDTADRGEESDPDADVKADADAEEDEAEGRGGFVVKQEPHSRCCTCSVCVTLRDLVNDAPTPTGLAPGAAPDDLIFMSQDGGFVVGKIAQKHHICSCHCPNCNNLRFKREAATVKCVALDDATLRLVVGEELCYQMVLSDEIEVKRRERIGKANKGKTAWNKGRKHSPETIAKIRANTAKAMKDPDVRRRLSEAATRNIHSYTTKLKIRRSVRDNAHVKMKARRKAQSEALGLRRGKVGVCSIGTYARRISAVQAVSFGVWTTKAMDDEDVRQKIESKRLRKLAQMERRRVAARLKYAQEKAAEGGSGASAKGVPKSEAHKAAISAALKTKWSDPEYISKQKQTARDRPAHGRSQSELLGGGALKRQSSKLLARLTPQEQKRAKLVQEMKDIYTKATAAVNALEQRKLAGLEVDEAMLSKALVAVEETRKVLKSVGTSLEMLEASNQMSEDKEREEMGGSGAKLVHVRGGKTVEVAMDVDPDSIKIA